MQTSIRILSDEVIGKIAAGEVVERPAAAIKELIENSLDAGASNITVEIRDGGIESFRVSDNGSGISPDNIRLAFERHATSKIRTSEDLFQIATLGFRGEALASIAAVSHLTCTTKTKEQNEGIRIQLDGGNIRDIAAAACPDGTTMLVRDLFYNTPVRLKFLKRPGIEAGLVGDVLINAILSRPDVAFRFISNGKTLYRSPGDGNLESAAYCIFGKELLAPTTRSVNGHMNGLIVKGYVGVGESGRNNRNAEHFYINGRAIQSPVLSQALEDGCRERVMIGHFPMCVLHITMPFESLDVNVHPNKLQVRFQKEPEVFQAVSVLVREALTQSNPLERPERLEMVPEGKFSRSDAVVLKTDLGKLSSASSSEAQSSNLQPDMPKSAPSNLSLNMPMTSHSISSSPELKTVPSTVCQPQSPVFSPVQDEERASIRPVPNPARSDAVMESPLPSEPSLDRPNNVREEDTLSRCAVPVEKTQTAPEPEPEILSFLDQIPKPLKILGVLFHTYILLEYDDQLLMIDQHAAHERLNFDRMMAAVDEHNPGQELISPVVLKVTPREVELAEQYHEMLAEIGLQVESFGETEIAVRSVPMILGIPQTAEYVREILAELEREGSTVSMERRRKNILQRACKHAVKGGEVLPESVIRNLVEQLVEQHVTPTCPHGRPLVVAVTHQELDKKFRRIQPT